VLLRLLYEEGTAMALCAVAGTARGHLEAAARAREPGEVVVRGIVHAEVVGNELARHFEVEAKAGPGEDRQRAVACQQRLLVLSSSKLRERDPAH
jgi:hypothetical protein